MFGPLTANATTYYSTYGQSRTEPPVTLTASGTHTFEVDGIAQYKTTRWFVNRVYKETDTSGFFAIDPDYSWSFSSGTTDIQADVYNSDNTFREYHLWHVTIQANGAPTTPGTISVSGVTTEGATLSWGASSDPDGDSVSYELQYTQTYNASDPWHSLGTRMSTSVILTGFSSGTTYSVRVNASDGRGGVSGWSTKDPAFTPLYPKTIISAYWLTPVYVTEGAVVTMRAYVSGFNVGDQFAFEIREDDSPFGSGSVTTKYGNVYSSGGNLYVDGTWTTVWESDQSGDPEFYFIVSRGSVSRESSRADADEMHVARGPILSRSPSSLSPSVIQGQNAATQSFEVWNSGGGTLSYSISDDATWLSASPSSGTSTGEHDTLTVTYSTSGLSPGPYNATITISASGAGSSPQTIQVALTVNPPPQTIISAYWLTPVYVTEGAVVTMRAYVSGFNVGDQFAFEIREDDSPFGSAYVTTKYGNVYSSGGNLYVDATWTTAWQSDQSGDPEFYFVLSRGGASLASSTVDANEMHVTQALDPYGVGALEPSGIGLFSTIPVENRNNLTDLANLKNNGLYYGSRLVNSTDRKLIIAIHGWNPNGSSDARLTSITDAIAGSVGSDRVGTGWTVIAYDWSRDADTGGIILPTTLGLSEDTATSSAPTQDVLDGVSQSSVSNGSDPEVKAKGFVWNPTEAAERAYQHGLLLGSKILQQIGRDNLEGVQLIGHSAGSWAVYGALRYLAANANADTCLQVTYLDPFIPAMAVVVLNSSFSVAHLESSSGYTRSCCFGNSA